MKQAIWTQTYDVNTIVLNQHKRLGLFGLLNILQDAAWIHASHLGHGYEEMIRHGTIWVLTRQKLVMTDWPVWRDIVTIRTWVRPIAGAIANRDYEVWVGERKFGECTACWLTMDMHTRRPQKLNLAENQLEIRTEGVLTLVPEKIPPRTDLASLATFRVRNSDLDLNGHVNNTRYAQWILDSVPDAHGALREYEVNFLAETNVGDAIVIERCAIAPSEASPLRWQYQGRRDTEGKPVFVARLGVVPCG